MKFMSSLDPKDRRLLLWSISIAIGLAIIIGMVLPNENNNDNPMPSTYLTGQHGARAAYDSLVRSGYNIERWERPLGELAADAGPGTVVIFAQPFTRETEDFKAVDQIVARGGRVLATGFWGGYLVPEGDPGTPTEFTFAACQLAPQGLDRLADTGEIWMAILRSASSMTAPGNRPLWSTTMAKATSCGGQVLPRLKTDRWRAPPTWTSCSIPSGHPMAITSTGTSPCMAMFVRASATLPVPP